MSTLYIIHIIMLAICTFLLAMGIKRRDHDMTVSMVVGIIWILYGLDIVRVWNA